MKKLFLAALVINLVVWLWGQREAPEIIDGLLSADVGAVRLVDEATVQTRAERLGAMAVPPPADDRATAVSRASPVDAVDSVPPPAPKVVVADEPQPQALLPDEPGPEVPPITLAPATQPDESTAEAPHATADATPEGVGPLTPDAVSPAPSERPTDHDLAATVSEPRTEGLSTVEKPGVGPGRTEPLLSAETASARADAVVPPAGLHTREVCETVGPFPQRGLADAFIALLPPVMAMDGMREERVPRPTRHWVLGPVQPSKEAASAYLAALQAAGIKDAWRAQSGVFAGRLVVGVFSTEENARRHAAMLAGKGVATEIRKQQAEEVRWWVDLRRGSEDGQTLDVPEGLQVAPRECGRVAAP